MEFGIASWRHSLKSVFGQKRQLLREIRLRIFALVGLLFANFSLWLLLGITLQVIEANYEASYKCGFTQSQSVKRVRRDFIERLWNETQSLSETDWKSLARQQLIQFEDQLHAAVDAGVHSYSGQQAWTIPNAVMFSYSIASGSGFGVLVPSSPMGVVLMVLASFVLCPVFFALLTEVIAFHLAVIKLLSFVIIDYHGSDRETMRIKAWVVPVAAFVSPTHKKSLDLPPGRSEKEINLPRVEHGPEMSLLRDIKNVPLIIVFALMVFYASLGCLSVLVTNQVQPGMALIQTWNTFSGIGLAEYSPLDSATFLVFQSGFTVLGMALFTIYASSTQRLVLKTQETFWLRSRKLQ